MDVLDRYFNGKMTPNQIEKRKDMIRVVVEDFNYSVDEFVNQWGTLNHFPGEEGTWLGNLLNLPDLKEETIREAIEELLEDNEAERRRRNILLRIC